MARLWRAFYLSPFVFTNSKSQAAVKISEVSSCNFCGLICVEVTQLAIGEFPEANTCTPDTMWESRLYANLEHKGIRWPLCTGIALPCFCQFLYPARLNGGDKNSSKYNHEQVSFLKMRKNKLLLKLLGQTFDEKFANIRHESSCSRHYRAPHQTCTLTMHRHFLNLAWNSITSRLTGVAIIH